MTQIEAFEMLDSATKKLWNRYMDFGGFGTRQERAAAYDAYLICADYRDYLESLVTPYCDSSVSLQMD